LITIHSAASNPSLPKQQHRRPIRSQPVTLQDMKKALKIPRLGIKVIDVRKRGHQSAWLRS
jgi:hypothetical protein